MSEQREINEKNQGQNVSLSKDIESRRRIVSEINENFFVEAGAGSGKTTMLVNRMVAMVENGIDISKICAITFTKAAAGEFYDRFQKLLIKRSSPVKPADENESTDRNVAALADENESTDRNVAALADENESTNRNVAALADENESADGSLTELSDENESADRSPADQNAWPGSLPEPTDITRERCRNALMNIDLCFMGTIDSFCSLVLSEHPSEAKVPCDARIISDEDAAALYRQEYVKISSGEYGNELQNLARTFQSLHRSAQDIFVRGMSFIMDNRNAHFNYHESGNIDIDNAFGQERREILEALKCLLEHPELKYDGNKESRNAWDSLGDSYRTLSRRWSRNYSGVLYALKNVRALRLIPESLTHHAMTLGNVFVPGGKGKKPKWLEFAFVGEDGIYEKLRKLQYDASMTFLVKAVPYIERIMREKGNLTYFDYLYYLRNMLRRDAEGDGTLIRYIYDRHSYYLIDEFQDTNPMQAEIFFYLSAEHPSAQWSECVPRKGSLFIVGDPKQSIYRFRSADVTSFLRVKKLFEERGGAILSLSRNFRSTRVLCEYYNRVFSALLPEETKNQSKYEEIPLPNQAEDEFQGIYSYEVYTGKAALDYPTQTDPVRIADMIENMVNCEEYQLKAEGDDNPRPIRYSDFMVITYGKKRLGPIMAELDLRGIPTKVEGAVPFAQNEALIEITRIFRAVADTDDFIALYSALTGKLAGLTKEDIMCFKASGGVLSIRKTHKLKDATGSTDSADSAAQKTSSGQTADQNASFGQTTDQNASSGQAADQNTSSGQTTDQNASFEQAADQNIKQIDNTLQSMTALQADSAAQRTAEQLERLRALHSTALRLSPAALFSAIMDQFQVYQIVSAENMEVVYYALELLRSAERSGTVISLKDGAAFLDVLISGASDEERCLSLDAGRDCVHMANLHKVKGLEAPIVILAAAGKGTFSAEYRIEHEDIGSEGWVFSMNGERDEDGRSAIYFQTDDYPDEMAAEKEALSDEEKRLIYVGATRARNVLILCDSIRIVRGKEVRSSKWAPIMEAGITDLWAKLCMKDDEEDTSAMDQEPVAIDTEEPKPVESVSTESKDMVIAAELYELAEKTSALHDRTAETPSYEMKTPSHLQSPSKLAQEQNTEEAALSALGQNTEEASSSAGEQSLGTSLDAQAQGASGAHRFPNLLGTTTHKLMEMLVTAGNQIDAETAVGEILREYRTPETEPYEAVLSQSLLKVAKTMRNGGYVQTNGLPQDILKELLCAEEVHCELPFCYLDEDEDHRIVWNGIMDVVYLSEGKWHIVDYKTNADGSDLDRKYQGQLSAYIRAFKAATGQDADAKTYHIDI